MAHTGLDPADVRYVIQTHLHADHVGAIAALEQFPKAEVIATRAERHYAAAPDWHLQQDYIADDICRADGRWVLLSDRDDRYDVFGDGSIRLVFTPGHTPGHMSVEVILPRTGSVVLTADAAYTRDHWEERALPGIVASTVDAVRSVQKLRRLAECQRSLVLFGHDLEQWQSTRHDEHYYD
jgi:glyoxylase-like metal-dependent hydrolase (beta-lactamase superfamily II)